MEHGRVAAALRARVLRPEPAPPAGDAAAYAQLAAHAAAPLSAHPSAVPYPQRAALAAAFGAPPANPHLTAAQMLNLQQQAAVSQQIAFLGQQQAAAAAAAAAAVAAAAPQPPQPVYGTYGSPRGAALAAAAAGAASRAPLPHAAGSTLQSRQPPAPADFASLRGLDAALGTESAMLAAEAAAASPAPVATYRAYVGAAAGRLPARGSGEGGAGAAGIAGGTALSAAMKSSNASANLFSPLLRREGGYAARAHEAQTQPPQGQRQPQQQQQQQQQQQREYYFIDPVGFQRPPPQGGGTGATVTAVLREPQPANYAPAVHVGEQAPQLLGSPAPRARGTQPKVYTGLHR
jgi:hypothetical protein